MCRGADISCVTALKDLLCPPDDRDALADALEKLARDPDLRRRMGRAARQRVLDGYTEGHIETAVLKIYASLLGDHSADRR